MKKKEKREKEEKKKEYSLLNNCKFSKTRLPRLVITKFVGTHFDWFGFWNQFESHQGGQGLEKMSATMVSRLRIF